MKTNNPTTLVKIDKDALQHLLHEVKETIANETNIKTSTQQPFGVADLWKIHRSTRYRVQRRNLTF